MAIEIGDLVSQRLLQFELGIMGVNYGVVDDIIFQDGSNLYAIKIGPSREWTFLREGRRIKLIGKVHHNMMKDENGEFSIINGQNELIAERMTQPGAEDQLVFEPNSDYLKKKNPCLDIPLPNGYRAISPLLKLKRNQVLNGIGRGFNLSGDEPRSTEQFNGPGYGNDWQRTKV